MIFFNHVNLNHYKKLLKNANDQSFFNFVGLRQRLSGTAHMSSALKEYLAANGDEKVTRMKWFLAVNIRSPYEFTGKLEDVIFGNIDCPAPFQFHVSDVIAGVMKIINISLKKCFIPIWFEWIWCERKSLHSFLIGLSKRYSQF